VQTNIYDEVAWYVVYQANRTILPSYGNGLVQSIYTAKPKTETSFGSSKSIMA